jgi:uncharacterized protein
MNKIIDSKINTIKTLCEKHKVIALFALGSVLTDKFGDDSDIDMLVDIDSIDPFDYTDHYFSLKDSLENIFDRPVDLLEKRALKNTNFIKNIEKNKQLIYGR